MQVVAIETTIGLLLLERKHTINLSFNLLYCCKVHTNAAAQVQIHYTLLCHCPPKSPFQIHFWKCLLERKFWFRVFSCCLICPDESRGGEGRRIHSSPTIHPTFPCPASRTLEQSIPGVKPSSSEANTPFWARLEGHCMFSFNGFYFDAFITPFCHY